ncbi:hypothetical protein [Niastella vici]|nr:hypothetical protein [Niastella vici]
MKAFILLLFTTICLRSFAQTGNIKRNAVFLSFEEFKNNTPSIHPIHIFLEQTAEDEYTLKYQDSTGNTEKYKRSVWGFSDSEDVYIRYNKHYAKFMAIGRICVFKYLQESQTQWSASQPGFASVRYKTKEVEKSYILDVNTGDIITLKVSAVKKLIADDTELLAEYDQLPEYNQERDKLTYITKYNERH